MKNYYNNGVALVALMALSPVGGVLKWYFGGILVA
jgi:hypothetical protein